MLFFPWFTLAWPIYFQTSIIAPFQGCIRLNLNKAISVSSRKTMTMQFLRITTFSIWSQLDSFQWEWLACWTVRNTYNFALSKTMPCLFHFFWNKDKSKWKVYLFYVPTIWVHNDWSILYECKKMQVIIIKIHEENMHESLY